MNQFSFSQTLFLKDRIMNKRQHEILIYNDCIYRNMYRSYFPSFYVWKILTGSSTSLLWTLTRWSSHRSTEAGQPWWRRWRRCRQTTQRRSAGTSAMSTSLTGWPRSTMRKQKRSWMGKSHPLLLTILLTSPNTCIWWTMCSGVQIIHKVIIYITKFYQNNLPIFRKRLYKVLHWPWESIGCFQPLPPRFSGWFGLDLTWGDKREQYV